MPQTTSNLTNSIRTLYASKYVAAALAARNYDQFSTPKDYYGVETAARLGSSITLPFLSVLPVATAVISQTADITARQFRDVAVTVTPTSRGDAIDWAEAVDTQVFTDYGAARFAAIGDQQMRSVEAVAIDAALAGSLFQRGAARASLDAGTAGHRCNEDQMSEIQVMLQTLRCPYMDLGEGRGKAWMALLHPAAYFDLRTVGNVESVGIYQDKEIILNWELGKLGPFKLLVSADSKVFGGAGIDNALAVATTIAASLGGTANQALGTTIEVASATNISAGDWLNIGTEETGSTFYPNNERVKWVSTSSTTITVVGSGPNGGLLNDHAVGEAVNNNDNVYPVLFGSPYSMVKIFDEKTGEFGQIVGPEVTGTLKQFAYLGWKWYGNYGITRQNCLVRGEFASSLEA